MTTVLRCNRCGAEKIPTKEISAPMFSVTVYEPSKTGGHRADVVRADLCAGCAGLLELFLDGREFPGPDESLIGALEWAMGSAPNPPPPDPPPGLSGRAQ